ncbi:hypothetical protein ACJX0J_030087, partial [Zea mays]
MVGFVDVSKLGNVMLVKHWEGKHYNRVLNNILMLGLKIYIFFKIDDQCLILNSWDDFDWRSWTNTVRAYLCTLVCVQEEKKPCLLQMKKYLRFSYQMNSLSAAAKYLLRMPISLSTSFAKTRKCAFLLFNGIKKTTERKKKPIYSCITRENLKMRLNFSSNHSKARADRLPFAEKLKVN